MNARCTDCEWVEDLGTGGLYESMMCTCPELEPHLDPSSGWRDSKGKVRWFSAQACRELVTMCGDSGRWFKQKHTEVSK